jgi:hypothetical protein
VRPMTVPRGVLYDLVRVVFFASLLLKRTEWLPRLRQSVRSTRDGDPTNGFEPASTAAPTCQHTSVGRVT